MLYDVPKNDLLCIFFNKTVYFFILTYIEELVNPSHNLNNWITAFFGDATVIATAWQSKVTLFSPTAIP